MVTNNASDTQNPIQAGMGGTGNASLTQHGVLIGEGSSAITALSVGTTGQVLIGSTSADPSFGALGVNSGLSAHGVVISENNSAFTAAATSSTSGVPLISQGSSSDPVFGTAVVAGGGTGDTSFTAYAVICGGTTTTGALQSIAGLGSSGQVLTSNGAGALPTFQAASGGGGLTWTDVTGTSQTMATANGYIADNAALVTLTLPTSAAVGGQILVVGKGAGGWKIAQNASQQINFESKSTTSGTGGSLASTVQYDCLTLTCVATNNTWVVSQAVGNITVV